MRATPRRAQCHIWAKVSVVLGRNVAVGWHCVLWAGPLLHVAFVGRCAQSRRSVWCPGWDRGGLLEVGFFGRFRWTQGRSDLSGCVWCGYCGTMREFMHVHPCLLLYHFFFHLWSLFPAEWKYKTEVWYNEMICDLLGVRINRILREI